MEWNSGNQHDLKDWYPGFSGSLTTVVVWIRLVTSCDSLLHPGSYVVYVTGGDLYRKRLHEWWLDCYPAMVPGLRKKAYATGLEAANQVLQVSDAARRAQDYTSRNRRSLYPQIAWGSTKQCAAGVEAYCQILFAVFRFSQVNVLIPWATLSRTSMRLVLIDTNRPYPSLRNVARRLSHGRLSSTSTHMHSDNFFQPEHHIGWSWTCYAVN